jgi:dTDP-L-rhamnose 4-epimerase
VLEVAAVAEEALDVALEPEILGGSRAADVRHCIGAIDRAPGSLGYEPAVPFADGMRAPVGWLEGPSAVDGLDEATAALRPRGLAR